MASNIQGARVTRQSNTAVTALWSLNDVGWAHWNQSPGDSYIKVHWYIKTASNPSWVWQAEADVKNYGEEFSHTYEVPIEANGVRTHLAIVYKNGDDWANDEPLWLDYSGNPRTNEPEQVANLCSVSLAAADSSRLVVTWTSGNTEVDHFEVMLQGYNGAWRDTGNGAQTVSSLADWEHYFGYPNEEYTWLRALVRPMPDNGQWKTGWAFSGEIPNPAYSAAEQAKMARPVSPQCSAAYDADFNRINVKWTHNGDHANRFDVYQLLDGGSYERVGAVAKNEVGSYTWSTTAAWGRTYRYYVLAVNTYNGCDRQSLDKLETGLVFGPPPPPTGFKLSVSDADAESASASIWATWTQSGAPATIAGFDLEHTNMPMFGTGNDKSASPTAASRRWLLTGVAANVALQARLRANNASGASAWVYAKVTPKVRPRTPGCKAELTGAKSVKVTVTSVDANAKLVRVYRISPGGQWSRVAELARAETVIWEDLGTKPGGRYRYGATCVLADKETESARAESGDAVTGWTDREPAAPTGRSAVAAAVSGDSGTVRLTFDDNGEVGGKVEVRYTDDPAIDLTGASTGFQSAEFPAGDVPAGRGRTVQVGGLSAARTWRLALRRSSDVGDSGWATWPDGSQTVTALVATVPTAPTPAAMAAAFAAGQEIALEWTHNNADGSEQQDAQVQVSTDGGGTWKTIAQSRGSSTWLDYTPAVQSGAEIVWRVRTRGLAEGAWSPWSEGVAFRVWAPAEPSATLMGADFTALSAGALTALPLHVGCSATVDATGENDIIEWWCEISSSGGFEALAADGTELRVADGAVLYSKTVKAGDADWIDLYSRSCQFDVGAADMRFTGGFEVRVGCLTAQGLRGEADPAWFACAMSGDVPEPDAQVTVVDGYACAVSPTCRDSAGALADVSLSVYRIGQDGSAVAVAEGLGNDGSSQAFDEHPNFGTCTYRIVALSLATGAQSMRDVAASIPAPGVYLQWDGGSVLLPFYDQLSEGYDPDVALMDFSGRRYPVPVFGTSVGAKARWKASVRKREDSAEIAALRELAGAMTECHVREPSGTGYPAVVKVSDLTRTRDSGVVSVDLDVTRVDGP